MIAVGRRLETREEKRHGERGVEKGACDGLLKGRPRSALWGLLGDFTFVPVALARCSEAEVAMTNSALLQIPAKKLASRSSIGSE